MTFGCRMPASLQFKLLTEANKMGVSGSRLATLILVDYFERKPEIASIEQQVNVNKSKVNGSKTYTKRKITERKPKLSKYVIAFNAKNKERRAKEQKSKK